MSNNITSRKPKKNTRRNLEEQDKTKSLFIEDLKKEELTGFLTKMYQTTYLRITKD